MIDNELYSRLTKNYGDAFTDFLNGKYEQPSDNNRWTGFVVNNMDPEFRGRVKILIIGKYDELPESVIPWAIPDIAYLGSMKGNFIVPNVGTILRGYFDSGDIHKPVFDSVAFNINNTAVGRTNIKSNYPNKMILMQTDNGECLTLDRKTGETRFAHRSGTLLIIDKSGNVNISVSESNANFKLNVPNGNVNISTNSGKIDINSTAGEININGGRVNLGNNVAKSLVNNLPNCLVTGAPHFVGVTNVFV